MPSWQAGPCPAPKVWPSTSSSTLCWTGTGWQATVWGTFWGLWGQGPWMATEGAPGGNEAAVGYAPPCAPSCSPRGQPGVGTSTAQGTLHTASRQLPEQPSQVCLVAEVGRGRRGSKVPGYQAKPRGTCSCQPAAPHLMGPESWEHRRREVSTQVRQASPAAKVAGAGGPCSSRASAQSHSGASVPRTWRAGRPEGSCLSRPGARRGGGDTRLSPWQTVRPRR